MALEQKEAPPSMGSNIGTSPDFIIESGVFVLVLYRDGNLTAAVHTTESGAKEAEMFPLSENAHDSLGEAYGEAGDTAAAIQCYERAEGLLAADMSPSERTVSRLAQMKSPPQQAAGYQKERSGKPPLGSGRSNGHWNQTNKGTEQAPRH